MSENWGIVIKPGKNEQQYWRDLWNYRELFWFLAWRDILIKYKQTVIGVAWSVIRPLLTMIIFTYVFGKLANLDSPKAPYPILVFSALLPWQFFANSLSAISSSVVSNSNLISKVYFPRLIIPVSSVMVNFVDFFISFIILIGLMVWYKYIPSITILMLPLFLILAFFVAIGFGLWIAALNVKYRDFTHIVPFIVQLGLYISPVGFSSSIVPEKWRLLYSLNPIVGVIDGFRWAIIGHGEQIYLWGLLISVVLTGIVLVTGINYFRRTEKTFADVI
jgi:lipopolysaccharide transport system permease protein